MKTAIRPARPEDDLAIGELLVRSFVETYAREMPEVVVTDRRKAELRRVAPKREGHAVWVVERDSVIVAAGTIFRPGFEDTKAWGLGADQTSEVRYFAVAPELQRTGVARDLLGALLQVARDDWKASAVCLHVRRGAHGVARFYTSNGFVRAPEGDDGSQMPALFLEAYLLKF